MILGAQWTRDPALAAVFTPPHATMGRYEVRTTTASLDASLADAAGDGVHFADVETLNPLDAFGAAGPYNRGALARLYGGRRVRVARGWAQRDGRVESVTLFSPYPNPALTSLHPGTMAIEWIGIVPETLSPHGD